MAGLTTIPMLQSLPLRCSRYGSPQYCRTLPSTSATSRLRHRSIPFRSNLIVPSAGHCGFTATALLSSLILVSCLSVWYNTYSSPNFVSDSDPPNRVHSPPEGAVIDLLVRSRLVLPGLASIFSELASAVSRRSIQNASASTQTRRLLTENFWTIDIAVVMSLTRDPTGWHSGDQSEPRNLAVAHPGMYDDLVNTLVWTPWRFSCVLHAKLAVFIPETRASTCVQTYPKSTVPSL